MERFPQIDEMTKELFAMFADELSLEELNKVYQIENSANINLSRSIVWNRFAKKALQILEPDSEPNEQFFGSKKTQNNNI